MAFKITAAAANAALDAMLALLNGGSVKIYDGTPPANAGDALSGNTLLATLPLSATAFAAAAAGSAAANAITADTAADATGTASFYRGLKSDGTTVACQGSVGTAGADMNLNTVAIQVNARVEVTSWSVSQPLQ
jgi:hypothetical protein